MATNPDSQSLLDYLPAIYREDSLTTEPSAGAFLEPFLSAYERLLIGEDAKGSLESLVAGVSALFDPNETPPDFLPWIASWVAFTVRADLELEQQRYFVSQIVRLYKRRGTLKNLVELIKLSTTGKPEIFESTEEFQLGVTATIGKDTALGGGPPHYFKVTISLPKTSNAAALQRQLKIATDLVEMEKPAHTTYDLFFTFPSFQLGVESTLGVDTLIGTVPTGPTV